MKRLKFAAKLIAISGALAGDPFYCDQDIISIGRDLSNALQLPAPDVSRWHCVIRREVGQYWITDLDSRNGTFVNGRRITRATVLTEGSVLQLGNHAFLFKLAETPDLLSFSSSGERRLESRSME